MKEKSKIYFIVSTVVIILLAFTLANGITIGDYKINSLKDSLKLGLDLKGGVSIEEQIVEKNVTTDVINRTKELINLRVNGLGVTESNVTVIGNNRIRIEMPGIFDAEKALAAVGTTGKLTFIGPAPEKELILVGTDIKDSSVGVDQAGNPEVQLKLTSTGAKKFAIATQKYLNKQIAIYMDKTMISNPTVEAVIADGSAVINNMTDVNEAKTLANLIKAGALPVTLVPATTQVIGASLGAEAQPTSAKAALIGVIIVMLFMLLYYRIPGLIANLGLTVFIMLTMLVFIFIMNATLTLPGIAGLLLSVGIAVDANVLMYERMREELTLGKSLRSAYDLGYKRALPSILDSNITTIISGLVLYIFGAGVVKGFALTLVVGVVCSLFTALVITRFLLHAFINAGWVTDIKYYRPFTRS
jgi:preprotein translocase subunit SecD